MLGGGGRSIPPERACVGRGGRRSNLGGGGSGRLKFPEGGALSKVATAGLVECRIIGGGGIVVGVGRSGRSDGASSSPSVERSFEGLFGPDMFKDSMN